MVVIGEQGEGQRHGHGEAAAGEGWRCVTLVLLAETHVAVPAINNSVVSKCCCISYPIMSVMGEVLFFLSSKRLGRKFRELFCVKLKDK